MALLEVSDLTMHYKTRAGWVQAVDGVSFSLNRGKSVGLVGESGCGKTSLAMSLLKLLPSNAMIKGGQIRFDGTDLVPLSEDQMRKYRWAHISMVFQAAMNSLNPVYTIRDQIAEAIKYHTPMSEADAWRKIAALFEFAGLDPSVMNQYPHEYSGGMKQRAVIAMALACDPDIIIADEPTTALDVIVQDRILKRMDSIRTEFDMAMIYISHDIAVIAEVSDRIGVMYAGKMMEMADAFTIFKKPKHPYTFALMSAFPSVRGEKHELVELPGEPPNLISPPSGCRFHPRCPQATAVCTEKEPPFSEVDPEHFCACWNPGSWQ